MLVCTVAAGWAGPYVSVTNICHIRDVPSILSGRHEGSKSILCTMYPISGKTTDEPDTDFMVDPGILRHPLLLFSCKLVLYGHTNNIWNKP